SAADAAERPQTRVRVRELRCGDGVVVEPEACDDGNTTSGDGCSSTCQLEGVATEFEPNDTAAEANALPVGGVGIGAIDPVSDRDYWTFVATANTTYVLTTSTGSDRSCGDLPDEDTALHLYDIGGVTVAFNEDISSINFCSQ